ATQVKLKDGVVSAFHQSRQKVLLAAQRFLGFAQLAYVAETANGPDRIPFRIAPGVDGDQHGIAASPVRQLRLDPLPGANCLMDKAFSALRLRNDLATTRPGPNYLLRI